MAEDIGIGVLDIQSFTFIALGGAGAPSLKQEIDLMGQGGTPLFTMAVLIQSMRNHSMILKVQLSEATGISTRFNKKGLQGQEFVFLRARTPDKREIDLAFFVHKISNIEHSSSNQSTAVMLECVTFESLISSTQSINRAYENSNYSDVAANIYGRDIIGTSKYKTAFKRYSARSEFKTRPMKIHQTDNTHDFIIPGLNPFYAIEWCARRSQKVGSLASLFLFYERFDGYCYHNVERLIREGRNREADNDLVFRYSPSEQTGKAAGPYSKDAHRKVNSIDAIELQDTQKLISNGGFRNKIRAVDMIKQRYDDINFSYEVDHANMAGLGDNMMVDSDFQRLFIGPMHEQVLLKDGSKQNQTFEFIQGHRMAYVQQLYGMKCAISIEGDLDVMPGQVCKFDIPEMSANEDIERGEITKFSGSWLIESVTNMFTNQSHSTSLSLIKDKTTMPGSGQEAV